MNKIKRYLIFAVSALGLALIFACKQKPGQKSVENKIEQFTVTFGVEGQGGELEASVDGKTDKSGSIEVESGKTVTFTAKPEDGWKVESWTGLPAAPDPADSATVTLKITKAENVKVKFTPDSKDKSFTVNGVVFKMKYIEAAPDAKLGGSLEEDNPPHEADLSAYLIGETEITQELYEAVMGKNPAVFDGVTFLGTPKNPIPTTPAEGEEQKKRPVEMVNWFDALLFCNALTEKTMGKGECVYTVKDIKIKKGKEGNKKKPDRIISADVTADWSKKGFRLPTEAEWEWAAKGGKDEIYGGANDAAGLKEIGWFKDNAEYKTHQVAIKKPNGYGLYDMNGNVWEWCWDWYVKPLPTEKQKDPKGAENGTNRVSRGGSWYTSNTGCTNQFRAGTMPPFLENFQGIRVVCTP